MDQETKRAVLVELREAERHLREAILLLHRSEDDFDAFLAGQLQQSLTDVRLRRNYAEAGTIVTGQRIAQGWD